MHWTVTVSSNTQPKVCTNKAFSSKSTTGLALTLAGVIVYILYTTQSKNGILQKCYRMLYLYMLWLYELKLTCSYRMVHYSYIAISNWFELITCFLTFNCDPYFFIQFQNLTCLLCLLFIQYQLQLVARYTVQLQSSQVYMDYTGLVWLHSHPCKALTTIDMALHGKGHASVALCCSACQWF